MVKIIHKMVKYPRARFNLCENSVRSRSEGREASRTERSDAILSLGSIGFVEVRLNESPPGAQQVYSFLGRLGKGVFHRTPLKKKDFFFP